jgi:uncharacterized protein (DUF58 family)
MSQTFITPQELHRFDNVELLAHQVVEGFIIGLHKSPFHGFSVEFAEHRLYNPGEATRHIDWKVYARSEKLFVKRYEEETNLRCRIIIDASSSMQFPKDAGEKGRPALNKLRFSVLAAASIKYMLKKQRDAVGLTIFTDKVTFHSRAKSATVHHNLLENELQKIWDTGADNVKTAAAQCIHEIADNIHRRSLVIIFSDMIDNADDTDEIFNALQHLKYNKHEVILFHVTDKSREQDFEFENRPYIFVDMESGEQIRLQPNQVKDYYREQMSKFLTNLKLRCAQYQIDLIEADINKDFSQILLPYFVKRNKMA